MKYLLVLLIFLLDRITKELAERGYFNRLNIDFFLNFYLTHNYGVAFGIDIARKIILIFNFLALIVLVLLYRKFGFIGLAFILGGLLGNLYDRVFYGYVIDFIHLRNFFVFNLADLFISLGGVLVFFKLIK
ncbi:MAG: signal peptidase II [Dictyoglomus turgidum]|uniref:signal peptidase II n=1 Tax=Dictyoglomus turgidum TaxID=513050 RepID=UPI003C78CE4B